jgi:hypothetical protein
LHTINKYKNKIMAQLSDRLNRLAPSATLAMSQKSSEMKAQDGRISQRFAYRETGFFQR